MLNSMGGHAKCNYARFMVTEIQGVLFLTLVPVIANIYYEPSLSGRNGDSKKSERIRHKLKKEFINAPKIIVMVLPCHMSLRISASTKLILGPP